MKKRTIIGIVLFLIGVYGTAYVHEIEQKHWYDIGNMVVSIALIYVGVMLSVTGVIK